LHPRQANFTSLTAFPGRAHPARSANKRSVVNGGTINEQAHARHVGRSGIHRQRNLRHQPQIRRHPSRRPVGHDLAGQEIQKITPAGIRYNNVDVLYGVELNGQSVDLAIAFDRADDTMAIFRMDQATGKLTDISSAGLKDAVFSILGVDDGEATAYGFAAYTSPLTGRHSVFVTQADGPQIAQLRITDAGGGLAGAELVRILELPEADSDDPTFTADLEGVSILYGRNGKGALVVSSQGDSTFAVFDRKRWDCKRSFAIGDGRRTDGVEGSDGLGIYSGRLGDAFPRGLLVAHDHSNDPAYVIRTPGDPEAEVQNCNTNFKYVHLRQVTQAVGIAGGDVGFDPREVPDALRPGALDLDLF
jgi:myo-inositol-hexaphosphate 3-phosphohydrolase